MLKKQVKFAKSRLIKTVNLKTSNLIVTYEDQVILSLEFGELKDEHILSIGSGARGIRWRKSNDDTEIAASPKKWDAINKPRIEIMVPDKSRKHPLKRDNHRSKD